MIGGLLYFALFAVFVLAGALGTVAARNPIRSAMALLVSILGIAGLYLQLSAEFLAAIQILVYAGAVVVLFLFVIMLLGPGSTSGRDARTWLPRYVGAGALTLTGLTALGLLASHRKGELTIVGNPPAGLGTVDEFSKALFGEAAVAFEISGVLLLVAIVGAVAVARGRHGAEAPATQKEAS